MKKGRVLFAAAFLFAMLMTSCSDDVSDLDVKIDDVNATTNGDGDNGSGGGHNPPPQG